ncbi:MAG: PQQ-dependent sugar dehydrogenase [Balneolaceae bacterium]
MTKKRFNLNFFVITLIIFTTPAVLISQNLPDNHYFPVPVEILDTIESNDQKFQIDLVVPDLNVPWGMAFLPDGRVLITERSGDLRLVKDGKLLPGSVSGVPQVQARGQGGLLDVELHPNYEENGWIYFSYSYTASGGTSTAIMRAKLQENSLVDQEVIFEAQPATNRVHHFGSRIVFDSDGYLYFSIGDRGEMNSAQDLSTHSGGVFRLYDDGRVPDDNPFVNRRDARPEFWTYGNRNIQGMTVHPETGEIWSHEHGPRGGDEINIIEIGMNYGWPEITYGINYNGSIITEDTAKAGMEQPLHYWDPSIAPSGMDFVYSDRYPNWKGDLMVGSLSFQYLHRVKLDGRKVISEEELMKGIGRVRSVKLAPDGFLYAGIENLGIVRLIPVE